MARNRSQMALPDDKRAFREFFYYLYRDTYRMAFFYGRQQETAGKLISDVQPRDGHQ